MSATSIRPATQQDLSTLLEFEQKIIAVERPMDPTLIQDRPISYYPIEDYIGDDATEVLVAEDEGQIIGSVYGQIKPRKDFFQTTHIGYIGFMYVKKSYRGQGVSQALIEAITTWFHQQDITKSSCMFIAKTPEQSEPMRK